MLVGLPRVSVLSSSLDAASRANARLWRPLRGVGRALRRWWLGRPRRGATVFGYLKADCGIGEAARNLFFALRAVDYPVAAKCLHRQFEESDARLDREFVRHSRHRYHIFHANAENTREVLASVHPAEMQHRYRIGFWAWELARFPDSWRQVAEHLDEIWVPSRFVHQAVTAAVSKPVFIFPHPVPLPDGAASYRRRYFGLKESVFTVLVALDLHSGYERKNPEGAIAAMRRAFGTSSNVQLVIKLHGIGFVRERARLAAALDGCSNTVVIDRLLTHAEMSALQACCDVFLSLHRSEGFGLNIAECMAHGKCAIATDYSGNRDFLDGTCGAPVRFRLVDVRPDQDAFAQGQQWADPDIEQAADLLVRAASEPGWREGLGAAARARVERSLSYRVVGAQMAERLNQIDAQRLQS
jgi:glycosyltransferase involved in cell wall biosynthesis